MNKLSIVITVALLALLAAGCSYVGSKIGSVTNSSSRAGEGSSTISNPGSDPRGEVETLARNFLAIKAFRGTANATGKTPMQMQVDYVAPDRYHLKMGQGLESIVIGKDTYMKLGGSWKKFPGESGKEIPSMRDMFTEEGLKQLSDVKYSGEESLNGETMLVYTYRGKTLGEPMPYDSKMFVSKATGLPARIEITYQSDVLQKMTIDYTYPADLKIEPPV
jgi:hypothetical protein